MLKKEINNISIWEIIMSIFIIGLINIYLIHLKGLEGILPIIEEIRNKEIWEAVSCGGILRINETNILIIIIINTLFILIFNSGYNTINKYKSLNYKGVYSTEYIYLISLGLLGLNIIILSNDLIFIFISLELYSLSIYLLVLIKITKNTSRMSIIYLLVNSLSSYLFLSGIAIIYKYTGSVILEELTYILNNKEQNTAQHSCGVLEGVIGIIIIIISLLIKLGIVPFNFWVLRLYTSLESRILLYQIIIPKIIYVYLLYKIIKNILPLSSNINNILIYLYILAIISVIIGSIGGLFNNYFKAILTYSSILNMGFILLGLCNNLTQIENNYSFIEYLLIYTFNTFALFYCFLLINPKSLFFKPNYNNENYENNRNYKLNYNTVYPFFTLFLLISIFSFIGIPPFAGFFAKLNIFFNLLNSYQEWGIVAIICLLIGTFISACFYLKFILYFYFRNHTESNENILISNTPLSISYYFSFFSIFLILYPFISNYLYPFYIILLNQ